MNRFKTIRSPISVNYEVTPVCNLRCEFCFAESECILKHPNLNHVKRIIDELYCAGVFEIRLFGGEFFTFPKWKEVVEYASKKGMFLSFVSNATLIDTETVKVLIANGIKGGAISIHGPDTVHDSITKIKGSYQRAVNGLRACLDGGLNITILTTITQQGKGRIMELFRDLSSKDLIRPNLAYGINRLCPYGRGKEDWDKSRMSLQDYLDLFPLLENITSTYGIESVLGDAFPLCLVPEKYHYLIQGCWQGTGFGHINSAGEVRGCAIAKGSYGNLLKTPLEKIWQGKGMKDFRKLEWLPSSCQSCKDFCGGGCSASRLGEAMYSPDEFLEGAQ